MADLTDEARNFYRKIRRDGWKEIGCAAILELVRLRRQALEEQTATCFWLSMFRQTYSRGSDPISSDSVRELRNLLRVKKSSDGPSPIERTLHTQSRFLEDVGVDHRRADILVSHQLLNGADVAALFQKVRCE
jgi:hypothetical protein